MFKLRIAALVALVVFMGSSVYAQEHDHSGHDHGDAVMEAKAHLVGEVIDVVCYLRMDAKGPKHIKCAEMCAKQGVPLGILNEKDNQIYLVFVEGHGNPNEKAMPFIGKRVEVMGKVDSKGGLKGITVEKISEVKK